MTQYSKRLLGAFVLLTTLCFGVSASASDSAHMAQLRQGDTLTCQPCDFSGEDLARFSNFSGADLTSANLSEVVLRGANLSGAILISVNFNKANLSRVNFTGAGLQKAKLQQADLEYSVWTNADLSGADLTGATGFDANTSGAKLCQTTMPNGTINDSGC